MVPEWLILFNTLPASSPTLAPHLDALEARTVAEGGFAPDAAREQKPRPDATAWAILALQAAARGADKLAPARTWLASRQRRDGRVTLEHKYATATWPTPLAILAWQGSPADAEAQQRALDFLLDFGGMAFKRGPLDGHDSTLVGWPWIEHTHSWVEPTALGLMALTVTGHDSHPRALEARKLLINRQLAAGGWNYGNPSSFGQALRAAPDSTGVALSALAEQSKWPESPEQKGAEQEEPALFESSLELLEREVLRLRTPLSLAWALLGLSAWNRRPEAATAWTLECLDRQATLGSYDTALLAQLLFAAHSPAGLVGSLTAPK